MWTLNSLRFCDKKGNFVLHEEYTGLIFSTIEYADKFISNRLTFWRDTFSTELTVSPDQNETIKMDQIEHVFRFVAGEFGLKPNVMFGRIRDKTIFDAKRFAFNILVERGIVPQVIQNTIQAKYPQAIGYDRCTIIHQRTKLKDYMDTEKETVERYEEIKDKVLISLNGRFLDDGSGTKLK